MNNIVAEVETMHTIGATDMKAMNMYLQGVTNQVEQALKANGTIKVPDPKKKKSQKDLGDGSVGKASRNVFFQGDNRNSSINNDSPPSVGNKIIYENEEFLSPPPS